MVGIHHDKWTMLIAPVGHFWESVSGHRMRSLQWITQRGLMPRLRYLSSRVTVSHCPWPPPGHLATSSSASWLLDCEALRKPFFGTTSLLFSTPLELSFADSFARGHNSAPDRGRALNPPCSSHRYVSVTTQHCLHVSCCCLI